MSKVRDVAKKVSKFAQKKREQAIVNIQNSTASGLILKWIFTNKLTVFLIMVILVGSSIYTYQINYYRELADRQRIQELTEDLAIEQAKTEQLNQEIINLKERKKVDIQINQDLAKTVSSLPAKKKKEVLLDYKNRLLKKREKGM
jgi:uncharacterized protein YlxW (UPF0749 family)